MDDDRHRGTALATAFTLLLFASGCVETLSVRTIGTTSLVAERSVPSCPLGHSSPSEHLVCEDGQRLFTAPNETSGTVHWPSQGKHALVRHRDGLAAVDLVSCRVVWRHDLDCYGVLYATYHPRLPRVAFRTQGALWILDLAPPRLRAIASGKMVPIGSPHAWSPDGHALIVSEYRRRGHLLRYGRWEHKDGFRWSRDIVLEREFGSPTVIWRGGSPHPAWTANGRTESLGPPLAFGPVVPAPLQLADHVCRDQGS